MSGLADVDAKTLIKPWYPFFISIICSLTLASIYIPTVYSLKVFSIPKNEYFIMKLVECNPSLCDDIYAYVLSLKINVLRIMWCMLKSWIAVLIFRT